jgi:hypothetical protein
VLSNAPPASRRLAMQEKALDISLQIVIPDTYAQLEDLMNVDQSLKFLVLEQLMGMFS